MPLCFTVLPTAFFLFATLAVDLRGQQLLEIDGVELRGNAQLILSGGGTCNVLESDTSYEEKKANHGAPMDVWRLEFSVHNRSGRWLDHLIARFQIEAEWPDCTNWDVPRSAQFAQILEWANSNGHIQETGRNVVAPGQTLAQTKLFIVLRGDPEPRFENWSMDFRFSSAPPDASSSRTSAPTVSAEQDTVFWQSIMNSTSPADFEAYLRQFPSGVFRALAQNRLEALGDHGGRLPASNRFPGEADSPSSGGEARAALSGQPFRPGPGTACAGRNDDVDCWAELANQSGCHVWDDGYYPYAGQPVTWTGTCSGGLAGGSGTLRTELVSSTSSRVLENAGTGMLRSGKKHGHWVESYDLGSAVFEGPYVDSVRHGYWVERWGNPQGPADVYEGPYVKGVRHGHWVENQNGYVTEGPYVNGKKDGRWVEEALFAGRGEIEDVVREGPYVNGEEHGPWVYRYSDGTTETFTWVNGEPPWMRE